MFEGRPARDSALLTLFACMLPGHLVSTVTRPRFFALDLLDNRYPALHGMRVLAIVSVVQIHVTAVFGAARDIHLDRDFIGSSLAVFIGMDLFFFLSGFLIGSILLHSLAQAGTQNIRRFYLRRAFRTFPSYYVVLTVLAVCFPMTGDQKEHLIYEYFYATNFLPLQRGELVMFWGWSLALEEQFYLTVPILFVLLGRLKSDRARVIVLAVLCAAALGNRLLVYFYYAPWEDFMLYDAVYFRTPTRFDALIAGILLAVVHQRYGERVTAWLKNPFHRALVLLPSLGCLWVILQPEAFGYENVQLVHIFSWGTLTSLMYFAWVLLLLHGDRTGVVHRFLSASFFRRIATLGYGVYLVHIPILDHVILPVAKALGRRHWPMAAVWPLSVVVLLLLSLAVAYVMHVFIEKPSLRVREWLAK